MTDFLDYANALTPQPTTPEQTQAAARYVTRRAQTCGGTSDLPDVLDMLGVTDA